MENEVTMADIAKDDNQICMGARIDKNGDADAFVHATDDEAGGVVERLIILFALLLKSLEQKTGYGADVICQVARKYLDEKHPGHDKGTHGLNAGFMAD